MSHQTLNSNPVPRPVAGSAVRPRQLWATLRPGDVVGAPGRRGRLIPAVPVQDWSGHLSRLGAIRDMTAADLIVMSDLARLTGRGGAAFPTGRKVQAALDAIRAGRRAVVVANCCDGDPTTGKDSALLAWSPHLVIDGALLLARALRSDRTAVAVHAGSTGEHNLQAALRTRLGEPSGGPGAVEIVGVPNRFVASEASSLVNLMNSGDARPLGRLDPIWRRGVDGGPTLVVNGETLANLALLARFGVRWFGELGVPEEPGTSLVTVTGSVPAPTVLEVAVGTPLRAVLAEVGAVPEGEALIGGLAGSWVDLSRAADVSYSAAGLRLIGARRGVGSMMVLPPGGCVLMETARIACYLAEQSAGQCGPCMFGLPTIAADCESLAHGDAAALGRLRRRLPVINGRGACSHPDGTVGLVGSALNALERAPEHLALHLRNGDCGAPPSVVPLPAASAPSLTAVAAPEDDGTQARSAAGRRFRSTPGLVMSQATAGSR